MVVSSFCFVLELIQSEADWAFRVTEDRKRTSMRKRRMSLVPVPFPVSYSKKE